MTGKRIIRGSGITERTERVLEGSDLTLFLRRYDALVRESGFFGAAASSWIAGCREILDGAGDPEHFAEDSIEDFAERIVTACEIAQSHVELGNADHAARWALSAGQLCATASLKFQWEKAAMTGAQVQAQRKAAAAKAGAVSKRQDWHDQAKQIWADDPAASVTKVAKRVAARFEADQSSVSRSIRSLVPPTSVSFKRG